MTIAYYNEHDPKAAAWLRQLIKNGDITPGEVDERSIIDVKPDDLLGFDRCHFFAGIGTWDYCLNQAGWGDRPVWTASLPCQPFSAAGKGLGKADERHLLPHFLELVRECKPARIIGEQVSAAIKHGWLDDLYAEMEANNYAVGSVVIGAHSVGAPHIRQRLYWLADSNFKGSQGREGAERADKFFVGQDGMVDWMGIPNGAGSQQRIETAETARHRDSFESASGVERMANTISGQREQQPDERPSSVFGAPIQSEECVSGLGDIRATPDIDWIYCRDNKYRPIKPGIQPLAHGITKGMVYSSDPGAPIDANNTQEARVVRLKGYGNAIQAQTAIAFISACQSL